MRTDKSPSTANIAARLSRAYSMLVTAQMALESRASQSDNELYNLSKTIEMVEEEVMDCVEALDGQSEKKEEK